MYNYIELQFEVGMSSQQASNPILSRVTLFEYQNKFDRHCCYLDLCDICEIA